MSRVRIFCRFSEGVDYPVKFSVITYDDIRVIVVNEKRRHAIDNVADVSMNQGAAVGRHIIRKRKLRKIIKCPSQQSSSHESAKENDARSFIAGEIICFALRIIKLFSFCLNVNVAVRLLPKI